MILKFWPWWPQKQPLNVSSPVDFLLNGIFHFSGFHWSKWATDCLIWVPLFKMHCRVRYLFNFDLKIHSDHVWFLILLYLTTLYILFSILLKGGSAFCLLKKKKKPEAVLEGVATGWKAQNSSRVRDDWLRVPLLADAATIDKVHSCTKFFFAL